MYSRYVSYSPPCIAIRIVFVTWCIRSSPITDPVRVCVSQFLCILSRPQVDLAFLRKSPQLEDASTHRSTFSGLRGAFEQLPRFRSTRSAWTQAYSLPRYRRLNAGVGHALLEQLTLFSNASIVLEDAFTHRSTLRLRVNAQTLRRQSHVNAGMVPESTNPGT